MSSFLDNFSDDNFVKHTEDKKVEQPVEVQQERVIPDTEQPLATTRVQATTNPGTFEHIEIDKTYRLKLQKKRILIGSISVLFLFLCIIGWNFAQFVKVPEWVGKPVADLQKWSVTQKVTVERTEKFDVKYEVGQVIKQDQAAGTTIRKGQTLAVVVSKGADPDEKLVLPDFTKMTEPLIKTWISDNKAENIKVISEFHAELKKGNYLRTEFKSTAVSATNYLRKDYAIVYVSKGKEVFEKNIPVPNFVGKFKAEVEKWAADNSVELTFEELAGTDENIGQAIGQSIAAEEKIAKHESMTIQISLGKAAIVPWFGNMLKSDAQSYMVDGLTVQVREQYHPTTAYGEMIYQSVSEGTALTGVDKKVTVVYSLGKPYLNDLVGMTENTLAPYFYNFRENGVEISHTVHYEQNPEVPKGSVIRVSRGAGYFENGTHIDIYVSQ